MKKVNEIFINEIFVGVKEIEANGTELIEFFENESLKGNYLSYSIPNLELLNSFELTGKVGERLQIADGQVAELKEVFDYYDEDYDTNEYKYEWCIVNEVAA